MIMETDVFVFRCQKVKKLSQDSCQMDTKIQTYPNKISSPTTQQYKKELPYIFNFEFHQLFIAMTAYSNLTWGELTNRSI